MISIADHDDGEQQFALEVLELRHLDEFIECIEGVQSRLSVQVAIATHELGGATGAPRDVLKRRVAALQLTPCLLRQPVAKDYNYTFNIIFGG